MESVRVLIGQIERAGIYRSEDGGERWCVERENVGNSHHVSMGFECQSRLLASCKQLIFQVKNVNLKLKYSMLAIISINVTNIHRVDSDAVSF